MSFASQVKEEIISHSFTREQKQAFLDGFIQANGELVFAQTGEGLRLTTISNKIARSLIIFVKEFFHGQLEIAVIQSKSLKKHKTFQLTLKGDLQPLLVSLELNPLWQTKRWQSDYWKNNLSLLRAFIAGIFVGSGSVNSPKTSNYHLEMQFKDLVTAEQLQQLLQPLGFDFKILARKNHHFLVYLKKSGMVSDFIKFIDAPQSVLTFENTRIARDMVNNINRIQNIDIHNQTRTIAASEKQIRAIKALIKDQRLTTLSLKTQALAELRLKYPDDSYQELSHKMEKSGFSITKSGISNLFRQILKQRI